MFTTTPLRAALAIIAGLLAPVFAPSLTFATLSAGEIWREQLLNQCVGFACNGLTGGGGASGTECYVTNLNNSGSGSLRACAESTNTYWIIFQVSGTIALQSTLHIASNKTIDGRGADITLTTGSNFTWAGSWSPPVDNTVLEIGHYTGGATTPISNIIITNLKFTNTWANAQVAIHEWASKVWLDHLTMQNSADEQLFVGCGNPPGMGDCQINTGANRAPTNITISWIHFKQRQGTPPTYVTQTDCSSTGAKWCSKSFLIGSYKTQESQIKITAHHNWYQTDARHPEGAYAWVHAFNNWYDGTAAGINANNANICQSMKLYSENEILDLGTSPGFEHNPIISGDDVSCGIGPFTAAITCVNAYLLNGALCGAQNTGSNFNPSSFYTYTPETANEALRQKIMAQSGWQNVTPPVSSPLSPPENLRVLGLQ
jgi:pectate lyase